MVQKKTLREREKELQNLLAHPAGRELLSSMEARYQAKGGRTRPPGTSIITYILVHEREVGMIGS